MTYKRDERRRSEKKRKRICSRLYVKVPPGRSRKTHTLRMQTVFFPGTTQISVDRYRKRERPRISMPSLDRFVFLSLENVELSLESLVV